MNSLSDKLKRLLDEMRSGKLYACTDADLIAYQKERQMLMHRFNSLTPFEDEKRDELMRSMFAKVGDNCFIQAPFHANWSGLYVELGNNVYANFNLTLVDDTNIYIGDNVLFGPNVVVTTASHPVDPSSRLEAGQYNLPVTIGNNVWIGANCTILCGVTIGDNTVIGAGSVVTRDIESDAVAFGTPCRVVRKIGKEDREKVLSLMP